MQGANLTGTIMTDANLLNTNLNGADLKGTRNLTLEQIRLACINDVTILPVELMPRKAELIESSKNKGCPL